MLAQDVWKLLQPRSVCVFISFCHCMLSNNQKKNHRNHKNDNKFVCLFLNHWYSINRSKRIPCSSTRPILNALLHIADVAATKHHQQRDEIRIIFTRTSSKSCFRKKCHAIYTPSALDAIQFAQHTLARLL